MGPWDDGRRGVDAVMIAAMRRARSTVMWSCVALALSACGPDGAQGTSQDQLAGTSGADTSSTSPSMTKKEASRALEAAKQELLHARTGKVELTSTVNGVPVIEDEGGYDLGETTFELTRWATTPEGEVYASVHLAIAGSLFMQMLDWPDPLKGCWLELPPEATARLSEVQPGQLGPPSVAAVLTSDVAGGGDSDALGVVLPAVAALQVLGISTSHLGDFEGAEDLMVPATISIVDGRVAWMRILGADVMEPFTRIPAELKEAVGAMKVRIDLTQGAPFATEPPADELIMLTDDDDMQGCPATIG